MRRTTRFRRLVDAPEILLLPGVHDALSVRLAEQAGFAALTCGGYSATASLLGAPDVAQLTMTEMADLYARLADLRRCRHRLRQHHERRPHGPRL